jgi:excinuclease ABC subunit C
VPGLGEARRKALLRHFGSVKRLAEATPEQIAEVPGIGRRTAEALLAALNPSGPGPAEPAPAETPARGAGRTRAGANRSRPGVPAPASVKTSAVEAAMAAEGDRRGHLSPP